MKKCYKAPEMDVLFVDVEGVVAGSIDGEGNGSGGLNPGVEEENGDAASYRSSLWN